MPREKLVGAVLPESVAGNWEAASREWEVTGLHSTTHDRPGVCHCGQANLIYLYTITNRLNGNRLYPIGSDCIHYFENPQMAVDAAELKDLFDMKQAVQEGRFRWDNGSLSRARIELLCRWGAWAPSRFNRGDARNDYRFMINAFNRRRQLTRREAYRLGHLLDEAVAFLRTVELDDYTSERG